MSNVYTNPINGKTTVVKNKPTVIVISIPDCDKDKIYPSDGSSYTECKSCGILFSPSEITNHTYACVEFVNLKCKYDELLAANNPMEEFCGTPHGVEDESSAKKRKV